MMFRHTTNTPSKKHTHEIPKQKTSERSHKPMSSVGGGGPDMGGNSVGNKEESADSSPATWLGHIEGHFLWKKKLLVGKSSLFDCLMWVFQAGRM